MLTNTSRWSHTRGNKVVPSRWQATAASLRRLLRRLPQLGTPFASTRYRCLKGLTNPYRARIPDC